MSQFRVEPFLLSIGASKDNVRMSVQPIGQALNRKKPLYIDILGADSEETAFFKDMCEDIIAGKAPVCHEDRTAAIRIAVYQVAEGSKFVFEPAGLDNHIQISFGKQVKERNGME